MKPARLSFAASCSFPVDGNHDLGSTGVSANLLADDSAPAFSGNLSGGDALSYFTDFYFPQNGPKGFDIQNDWNVTTSAATGFTLTYQRQTYNSPAAISAFRASTKVNTGTVAKTQIDHQSNYSFDYGNAHFLFLDANPHLFNDNLPGLKRLQRTAADVRRLSNGPGKLGHQRSRFQQTDLEDCRLSPARVHFRRCDDREWPDARRCQAA